MQCGFTIIFKYETIAQLLSSQRDIAHPSTQAFLSLHSTTSQCHLKIASINIVSTSISRAQNSSDSNRARDLLREADTRPASTSTSVTILLEDDIRSASITSVPNVPASTIDNISHAGALEDHASESTPWATEVVCASGDRVASGGGDGGLVDHVVSVVVGSTSGSGDVALGGGKDADVDLFEPGLGVLAEDEIGGTLDVGLSVELGAILSEDGVLVAVEAAGVVALLAVVGGEGEGLGALTVGVLDVDVVCMRREC